MLRPLKSSLPLLMLGMALGGGLAPMARAATPETAPADLMQALSQIEAASDSQNLAAVMAFYGQSFASTDGFDRAQLEQTLGQFWQQYAVLDYSIELVAWDASPNGVTAETITRLEGTQTQASRELALTAEVRSRQRFENGKIVYQEILSEQSQLSMGDSPPGLTINLPAQIEPGASYTFDAIVQEPLGNRSLLGVALDEGVTAEDFLAPRPLVLESLNAGGLFKIGQAPDQPDNRWISAVIVREDGVTVETRRMRVGE